MATGITRIDGKQVVVTGATAGIGRAAAVELASRGADVVIVGRNVEKAAEVIADIGHVASDTKPRFVRADLSELAQVRTLAGELLESVPRLDVLVNNAGISARRAKETVDGFDEMMAANYLGPFLLTHLLLERLQASAPSRIVVVGSEAHRTAGRFDAERFEDLGDYSGAVGAQMAYGRTKLLDMLFADELARRLGASGVTVNSLCPGLVGTELIRDSRLMTRLAGPMSRTPLVRTPDQGARMTVRLASSADVEGVTGRFFTSTPGARLLPTAGPRRDPAIARRVYDRTCDLVHVDGVGT